jgi:hypothetical protein
MFKKRKLSGLPIRQSAQAKDAIFMGWQKTSSGEDFALYNITAAGHPSLGSTVTGLSLLKMNLQIPQTPIRPVR